MHRHTYTHHTYLPHTHIDTPLTYIYTHAYTTHTKAHTHYTHTYSHHTHIYTTHTHTHTYHSYTYTCTTHTPHTTHHTHTHTQSWSLPEGHLNDSHWRLLSGRQRYRFQTCNSIFCPYSYARRYWIKPTTPICLCPFLLKYKFMNISSLLHQRLLEGVTSW